MRTKRTLSNSQSKVKKPPRRNRRRPKKSPNKKMNSVSNKEKLLNKHFFVEMRMFLKQEQVISHSHYIQNGTI